MIERIKSIKRIQLNSKRYDLTVEKNHNFYANGVLVHNCQNFPEVLTEFKGVRCFVTEKLDGSSISLICHKRKFYVCSRNLVVTNKNTSYWQIAEKYDIEKKLKSFPENIAIQGEIIGSGVQGNKYKIERKDFYLFNIWLIDRQRYMGLNEMRHFCTEYGFKMVPVMDDNFVLNHTVDELIEYSKGKSVLHDVMREGIVIRDAESKKQSIRGIGGRLSFKVKNPDFLIKYE